MRIVEGGPLSQQTREELIAGEHQPFGAVGEGLHWREKTHSVCVLDDTERPLAAGGLVVAEVSVAAAPPFEVAGIGGVIVTRSRRGQGLARIVMERLLAVAAGLGPSRAMLFCLTRNVPLYVRFGFSEIAAPVRAEQPDGPVPVPMHAMWRALHGEPGWPAGPVLVRGEPF
jgi:GNAT superfamily N-acetyltransferase